MKKEYPQESYTTLLIVFSGTFTTFGLTLFNELPVLKYFFLIAGVALGAAAVVMGDQAKKK